MFLPPHLLLKIIEISQNTGLLLCANLNVVIGLVSMTHSVVFFNETLSLFLIVI
jgi:hypothetical protein